MFRTETGRFAHLTGLLGNAGLEGRVQHVHQLWVLGVGIRLGVAAARRRSNPPVNLVRPLLSRG